MIHDAQLDYYGKRLATCSSDRTCKIFAVDSSSPHNHQLLDVLHGHEGPVWQVAWAHPKFGAGLLATASYDTRVFIWQQQANGKWLKVVEHTPHTASVNSIAWAPHEYGLILACASSDGKISVLTAKEDGTWDHVLFAAHSIGVNAVSWAPAAVPGSLINSCIINNTTGAAPPPQNPSSPNAATNNNTATTTSTPPLVNTMRLASGGCDNRIRIWKLASTTSSPTTTTSQTINNTSSATTSSSKWEEEHVLDGHSDWIRDVAWAPNMGLTATHLASCSQDKTVVIWTQPSSSKPFTKRALVIKDPSSNYTNPTATAATAAATTTAAADTNPFKDVCWRVSWSPSGNILAVSSGDNSVTLWKENLDGMWQFIGDANNQ